MKQLYIPSIGDKITLAQPWKFTIHEERRNLSLIKMIDPNYTGNGWVYYNKKPLTWTAELPTKWELRVDRIYIRNGQSSFDSMTFSCHYNGKKVRFWVKLDDANQIVMEEDET